MIHKLKYGNTNTFFIRGINGGLLVDTDYAGTFSSFCKAIKEYNVRISDITYVLATHYHPDHVGLIGEFMEQGVKLLLIDKQKDYIHFSDEIFKREGTSGYTPIDDNNAVVISCERSRKFFEENGIKGEIISTPSHSNDSISLILDNGACFVGDLEPKEHIDAYEEGNEALRADWELITSYNPKIIYFTHRTDKRL